mgnify:CR=1 FL=1
MSDLPQPELTPGSFVDLLKSIGVERAWFVYDAETGELRASDSRLEPIRSLIASDTRDFSSHEGVFLAVGPTTGALFGAFVHKTCRGQGQGGLRYW